MLCLVQIITFAQNNQVLYLNGAVYNDISHLQKSGYLFELNPTKLPYKTGEVSAAMSKIKADALSKLEKFWYNKVNKELTVTDKKINKGYIYSRYFRRWL